MPARGLGAIGSLEASREHAVGEDDIVAAALLRTGSATGLGGHEYAVGSVGARLRELGLASLVAPPSWSMTGSGAWPLSLPRGQPATGRHQATHR
jgi:hypothetical protein